MDCFFDVHFSRIKKLFLSFYNKSILYIFLAIFSLPNMKLDAMQIYEICTDLFIGNFDKTEYYSYVELKQNPLPIKVNYLAAPWLNASMTKKNG